MTDNKKEDHLDDKMVDWFRNLSSDQKFALKKCLLFDLLKDLDDEQKTNLLKKLTDEVLSDAKDETGSNLILGLAGITACCFYGPYLKCLEKEKDTLKLSNTHEPPPPKDKDAKKK